MAVITPSSRLLFWLRASFLFDVVFGAIGGVLIVQDERVGWIVLVFAGVRAVVGVVALVITVRMLAERRDADDRPSVVG